MKLALCVAILLISLGYSSLTLAKELTDKEAVKVIVAEAANQGLKGMICVAEVLRRRGSTKGFYGYRHNKQKQPSSVWAMASEAWQLSKHTNYTKGADHFENVRAFGKPWWVEYCVKTYEYKDHIFYKELPRH